MTNVNSFFDIFDKINDANIDLGTTIKVFLIALLITLILWYFLPLKQTIIVGVILFVVLYLATLLNIIE